MFLPRHVYDTLSKDKIAAEAIVSSLTVQNAQLQAHIEWMRVRLTQVEFERANLIRRYMGVDVPVPSFDQPDHHPDPNQTLDFNDIGDKAADALGLEWNADGTIRQKS